MNKNCMTLETFISQCPREIRHFLEWVYKRKGTYVTEQVIAEIVHRVGIERAEDFLRGRSQNDKRQHSVGNNH